MGLLKLKIIRFITVVKNQASSLELEISTLLYWYWPKIRPIIYLVGFTVHELHPKNFKKLGWIICILFLTSVLIEVGFIIG